MAASLSSRARQRRIMSKSPSRPRPPVVNSVSMWTARPSMRKLGTVRFGKRARPRRRFTHSEMPSVVSRWRMCVYSWVIRCLSQESYLPQSMSWSGGVR
ncbi:hypothetical protein D3C72_2173350 [compost metagenome]